VDKNSDPTPSPRPAALGEVKESVHSDLQYVSIQVDGKTYGGWYRMLPDGQMELLALANVHSERRPEHKPIDQARGMLADFIRVARPNRKAEGSPPSNAETGLGVGSGDDRQTATLGDLLYTDTSKTPISERDWVDLVQAIGAGDQLALRALFDRMHRVVFTLMMRLTDDREAAEALTLDVFHDVWRRASTFDAAGGSVVTWIMNQTRSRAIDHLQSEHGRRASPGADLSSPLRNALVTLTPMERQVIETAFFSGIGFADVAARLHQPLDVVETNVHSGLHKLRRALAPGAVEL